MGRLLGLGAMAFGLLFVGAHLTFGQIFPNGIQVSNFTAGYGSGASGALTVAGPANGPTNPLYINNTTAYLTSAASSGATSLTVNSTTGFAANNVVLIIQMLGTGAGKYEMATVASASGTTISLSSGTKNAYTAYSAGSQVAEVILVPQYTTVTINSGGVLAAPAFSGSGGGVLAFQANGGVTVNYNATLSGTITAASAGFSGGATSAAGSGPGGGASGVGGINTTPGSPNQLVMGSGGGGGSGGAGGSGGGIILIDSASVTNNGTITAAGGAAAASSNGGGGAGGTIFMGAGTYTTSATCGTLTSSGGSGQGSGTNGGNGRTFVYYSSTLGCSNGTPTATSVYRKFPAAPSSGTTVNLTISANTNNYNIYTAAGSPATVVTVNLTINSGVTVGSTSTGTAALVTGSGWVAGSTISIVNNGTIIGKGGAGGAGGGASNGYSSSVGSSGAAGGAAISLSWPVTITNGSGDIWGGGGGGGGGGGAAWGECAGYDGGVGGGGGGGGCGTSAGAGGAAGASYLDYPSSSGGSVGSASAGGSGGAGDNYLSLNELIGGTGGAGGTCGSSGSTGGTATSYCGAAGSYASGGAGGVAGNAITTNSNAVTWVSGSSSPNVQGAVN